MKFKIRLFSFFVLVCFSALADCKLFMNYIQSGPNSNYSVLLDFDSEESALSYASLFPVVSCTYNLSFANLAIVNAYTNGVDFVPSEDMMNGRWYVSNTVTSVKRFIGRGYDRYSSPYSSALLCCDILNSGCRPVSALYYPQSGGSLSSSSQIMTIRADVLISYALTSSNLVWRTSCLNALLKVSETMPAITNFFNQSMIFHQDLANNLYGTSSSMLSQLQQINDPYFDLMGNPSFHSQLRNIQTNLFDISRAFITSTNNINFSSVVDFSDLLTKYSFDDVIRSAYYQSAPELVETTPEGMFNALGLQNSLGVGGDTISYNDFKSVVIAHPGATDLGTSGMLIVKGRVASNQSRKNNLYGAIRSDGTIRNPRTGESVSLADALKYFTPEEALAAFQEYQFSTPTTNDLHTVIEDGLKNLKEQAEAIRKQTHVPLVPIIGAATQAVSIATAPGAVVQVQGAVTGNMSLTGVDPSITIGTQDAVLSNKLDLLSDMFKRYSGVDASDHYNGYWSVFWPAFNRFSGLSDDSDGYLSLIQNVLGEKSGTDTLYDRAGSIVTALSSDGSINQNLLRIIDILPSLAPSNSLSSASNIVVTVSNDNYLVSIPALTYKSWSSLSDLQSYAKSTHEIRLQNGVDWRAALVKISDRNGQMLSSISKSSILLVDLLRGAMDHSAYDAQLNTLTNYTIQSSQVSDDTDYNIIYQVSDSISSFASITNQFSDVISSVRSSVFSQLDEIFTSSSLPQSVTIPFSMPSLSPSNPGTSPGFTIPLEKLNVAFDMLHYGSGFFYCLAFILAFPKFLVSVLMLVIKVVSPSTWKVLPGVN